MRSPELAVEEERAALFRIFFHQPNGALGHEVGGRGFHRPVPLAGDQRLVLRIAENGIFDRAEAESRVFNVFEKLGMLLNSAITRWSKPLEAVSVRALL